MSVGCREARGRHEAKTKRWLSWHVLQHVRGQLRLPEFRPCAAGPVIGDLLTRVEGLRQVDVLPFLHLPEMPVKGITANVPRVFCLVPFRTGLWGRRCRNRPVDGIEGPNSTGMQKGRCIVAERLVRDGAVQTRRPESRRLRVRHRRLRQQAGVNLRGWWSVAVCFQRRGCLQSSCRCQAEERPLALEIAFSHKGRRRPGGRHCRRLEGEEVFLSRIHPERLLPQHVDYLLLKWCGPWPAWQLQLFPVRRFAGRLEGRRSL
mmetsp:Transcript_49152/g.117171  ORF Transcript_49152/g.117171 Transcript_49152/m.117171 type:complete len:261 (+) Transcript_49152:1969-2751(+)